MEIFNKISEEKIQKAIQGGEFENLRGEGKPFPPDMFSSDPQNEFSLVHDLLKKNGMSLPWIEERKALQTEMTGLRNSFYSAWKITNNIQEKENLKNTFREELNRINRRILDYNVRSPVARLQLNEMSLPELIRSCEKTI